MHDTIHTLIPSAIQEFACTALADNYEAELDAWLEAHNPHTLDEAEIDALYVAEMERRDREAAQTGIHPITAKMDEARTLVGLPARIAS